MSLFRLYYTFGCNCHAAEVRQTYGCAEYESTKNELVLSESNDTVVLRCVHGFNIARTWTLKCEDGEWTANDGRTVDCLSNKPQLPLDTGSGVDASTSQGNQGTLGRVSAGG